MGNALDFLTLPIFTKVWGELDKKELSAEEEALLDKNINEWNECEARISKIPEKWFDGTIIHPLLRKNEKVLVDKDSGLINDFICLGYTLPMDEIGKIMDSAGPSLLFRNPTFIDNLAKFLQQKKVGHHLNPVACVNNEILFNVDQDVGMMCLLGMLMPILKQYSNEMKIQLLSMFLFGLTHDGAWNLQTDLKFKAERDKATRASIRARVKALLPRNVQSGKDIVRLAMMTGISAPNATHGHWVVIVFDFDVSDLKDRKEGELTPTTAFYFPEWDFDCSKLVTSIADICNFQPKSVTRILAASSRSFAMLKDTKIKLLCGCSALRHLIMCSVLSTDDLANKALIQTVYKLDQRFGETSFPIFLKMWIKLMEKKEQLEKEQVAPNFFERDVTGARPLKISRPGYGRLKFLLLCSPVKDPGVDISNCEDPPFLELTVHFPTDGGDPVIGSATPLYYIDEQWTSEHGPSQQCAMQTEFWTMDILSALHRRVMGIESKLM